MYQSFVAGRLDRVEFLIPQLQPDELQHYRQIGQYHISNVPFVDAIYFIADRPPFENPEIRRAFVMATDRERLAREIQNQLPATGGYIPPGLPGHSSDIALPYDPQEARRLLALAGYPKGRGFPSISLLLGLVRLEKGDNLVFDCLQKMWLENLGIKVHKCWSNSEVEVFGTTQNFHLFFIGWLADYPDPASFLQTNYLIDQTHWHNSHYKSLIEEARHIFDQQKRMHLYHQADRILMQKSIILPLFYGHIHELRQPWVQNLTGSSIYSPQWKDITLLPH